MRRLLIVIVHWFVWTIGFAGAYLLRFDGVPPDALIPRGLLGWALLLPCLSLSFWAMGLFHGMFRYASIRDVRAIVIAVTLPLMLVWLAGKGISEIALPRSIYVGTWLTLLLVSTGPQLGARLWRERRPASREKLTPTLKAILVGAGDAGEMLLRDLRSGTSIDVVGILDDDATKRGASLRGVRVLGPVTFDDMRKLAENQTASMVILAIPSATGQRVREIVGWCNVLRLDTKTIPSLGQLLEGSVTLSTLREVVIEDLLRRDPVKLDEASLADFVGSKRIFITGAAGSIGSELARQVLRYNPKELWLLDHNENGLFFLERELVDAGATFVVPSLVDIRDRQRVRAVFELGRPDVVFHAAAHKHVPLMEINSPEAVKNNAEGTRIVAEASEALGVHTFVMISTDKAVRPTSIMGATKRVAEMYLQAIAKRTQCRFITVRFGNVLGSAGSVVQIFRQQIAAGGPVTVTHEAMTRYFMTISEACQLVLLTGAIAKSGMINILDMGEPVKILDLARDMVRLSGLEPGRDIEIKMTGIRNGEKLFEELLLDDSTSKRRLHPKILLDDAEPPWSSEAANDAIEALAQAAKLGDSAVRATLSRCVPDAQLAMPPMESYRPRNRTEDDGSQTGASAPREFAIVAV